MSLEDNQAVPTFLEQLVDHGLLIPSPTLGIYGRSGVMEDIITRLDSAITGLGCDDAPEVMRFPPVMSRATVEQSGYLASFPQLLGVVHSFAGKHKEHQQLLQDVADGHDWAHHLSPVDAVLTPAACYPVYGTAANTVLTENGRLVDVSSYCFRHEPSLDPARMQSFRQREYVRLGNPAAVQEWRDLWTQRGLNFLLSLELQVVHAPANDPFFGPGGRFLAASQQEQQLKFELLAPVSTEQPTTAITSLNYHQEHFGEEFNIRTADGAFAHTACIGFGLERIALGLVRAHGFDPREWPATVRARLWS